METQQSATNTGEYPRLHVFFFSMAYLGTMLALDMVYSLLRVHGFMRKSMSARSERLESRRAQREAGQQTGTRIPVASVAMDAEITSGADAGLTTDMEQAA